jgi:hypothetical protein
MSAATIYKPHSASPPGIAEPVPLFPRHMLGAIEAARDRRHQNRNRAIHRYSSGDTDRVTAVSVAAPGPRSPRRPAVECYTP